MYIAMDSISKMLLLTMFIYLPYVKNKKYRKFVIPILVLVGIFLSMLIGTRAGLFGFIIIIALYMGIEVLFNILKNEKIDKKFFIIGINHLKICILRIPTPSFYKNYKISKDNKKHLKKLLNHMPYILMEYNYDCNQCSKMKQYIKIYFRIKICTKNLTKNSQMSGTAHG
jgi:hypothetical protein